MNQVISDIWPLLMTALLAAIGWQFRESYVLKTKVAVMEKTIEALDEVVKQMQKRQDSHSKKQDEILTLITDFKLEVVKQIGEMSSDLKTVISTMEVFDDDVRVPRKKQKKG